mmetsp:Transcript_9608/g.31377  ORF Transcript_9608/g.31377 Transcript_9608/m.31377 type:complete len:273 (-) Transcript_9608:906-1724(-)
MGSLRRLRVLVLRRRRTLRRNSKSRRGRRTTRRRRPRPLKAAKAASGYRGARRQVLAGDQAPPPGPVVFAARLELLGLRRGDGDDLLERRPLRRPRPGLRRRADQPVEGTPETRRAKRHSERRRRLLGHGRDGLDERRQTQRSLPPIPRTPLGQRPRCLRLHPRPPRLRPRLWPLVRRPKLALPRPTPQRHQGRLPLRHPIHLQRRPRPLRRQKTDETTGGRKKTRPTMTSKFPFLGASTVPSSRSEWSLSGENTAAVYTYYCRERIPTCCK